MNTIYNDDMRTLSDSQLLYNLGNKVELDEKVTFEEIIRSLTPGKKNFALAILELYKRSQKNKQEVETINCSNRIYDLMFRHMYGLSHEEFWVIFMNQGFKPIKVQRFSTGGLTSTLVDCRVILKEAILCSATAAALVHNHPSGNDRPSKEDDSITVKLCESFKICNIKIIDHLIFTDSTYYSYADEGKI